MENKIEAKNLDLYYGEKHALPFNSVRFLTTGIVSEMGYASGTHRQVLFTIGLVLFVFIIIINLILTFIIKRGDQHE